MLVDLVPLVSLLASPSFPIIRQICIHPIPRPLSCSNMNESKLESEVSASMDNYQKIEKIGEGTFC
jgi:hypothetical protein